MAGCCLGIIPAANPAATNAVATPTMIDVSIEVAARNPASAAPIGKPRKLNAIETANARPIQAGSVRRWRTVKSAISSGPWRKPKSDIDAAVAIGDRVETGTCYMNRCDYVDPALVWTGVKDTGRGVALSVLGFDSFTRPKSFHLKSAL